MNRVTPVILLFFMLTTTSFSAVTRDPTVPMNGGGNSALSLEGTFITKSKRMALIGGHYYVIGDNVGGGELVAILSDRVVIKKEDGMKVYQLVKKIRKH